MKRTTKNFATLTGFLLILFAVSCNERSENSTSNANQEWLDWKQEKITPEELGKWQLLGKGSLGLGMNQQTVIQEVEDSNGVMLLSPTYYSGDVLVRYQALALTPASVFVMALAAADTVPGQLTIPADYDGGMALWTANTANYFFAFKNAPHGATPFIAKNPGFHISASADTQDGMVAGVYYDIEVGKEGQKLWLSIDGKTVVSWDDDSPIGGGHVAFRLRGTAGLLAAGAIRNLTIYSK